MVGMAESYLNIIGYRFQTNDPIFYALAWAIVTIILVLIATESGSTAVGLALTALLGVAIVTYHWKG